MRIVAAVALLVCASCIGSTGGERVSFEARAAGPKDAVVGKPFEFTTPLGFAVRLTSARLHVQAIYLDRRDRSRPERETSCYSADAYVGELRTSTDIDLLDGAPKPFTSAGAALAGAVNSADVWLGEGDINALSRASARQIVLHAAGVATKGSDAFPFTLDFRIDANRVKAPDSSALPGSNPICQQRIVSKIPTSFYVDGPGTLVLRVDPRPMFDGVDFSGVPMASDAPRMFRFLDDDTTQASATLMNGLRRNRGVYSFEWIPSDR